MFSNTTNQMDATHHRDHHLSVVTREVLSGPRKRDWLGGAHL